MANREVCGNAIDLVVTFEGIAKMGSDGLVYPYHDAIGLPTIGVGHLLSKIPNEDLSKYPPITVEAAHVLHKQDLNKFAIGVCELVTRTITDNQFGALVSLAFNIGVGNLKSSTLLRKLNAGAPIAEVGDEFLKWNKAGGKVFDGLTRRRIAERTLFLK